jgi:hypothetical protein
MEQAQLRWLGHLNRMDEEKDWPNRFGKQEQKDYEWNDPEEGHAEHGMTIYKNITWKEAKKLSEDRTAWRALCKNLDTV